MVIMQTFNKRINAFVKFDFVTSKKGKSKVRFFDVKQKNPTVKFKGIKVSKKSSRR